MAGLKVLAFLMAKEGGAPSARVLEIILFNGDVTFLCSGKKDASSGP